MILISQHHLPGAASEWWCKPSSFWSIVPSCSKPAQYLPLAGVLCNSVVSGSWPICTVIYWLRRSQHRHWISIFLHTRSPHPKLGRLPGTKVLHFFLHSCVAQDTWTSNLDGNIYKSFNVTLKSQVLQVLQVMWLSCVPLMVISFASPHRENFSWFLLNENTFSNPPLGSTSTHLSVFNTPRFLLVSFA